MLHGSSPPRAPHSFSRKVRFAFFAEGGDAFAVIVGSAEFALQIAFEIELLLEPRKPAFAHRHFDRSIATRRSDREARSKLLRFCVQFGVIHTPPNEAPRFRL